MRPSSEDARLQALHDLDVLDTPPEERFDQIVRLAQRIFDVPTVAVNLVDADRQFTKSAVGHPLGDRPRDESFCSHTVAAQETVIVRDARLDERFAHHPDVVDDGDLRFYVGQPLAAPSGEMVGALCLVDDHPRDLSEADLSVLADLGHWVERELASDDDERQAREVQRRLLPYRPLEMDGYAMAGCCLPARHVGGDYFDWSMVSDRLQVVLADVMGKGMTAAVLTAGIRAMMRGAAPFESIEGAVYRTAAGMADDFTETGTFATMFACRIEPATGEMDFVDAGHGLALIVPPHGEPRRLRSRDLPLGVITDDTWTAHRERLAPGETLMLVSDGIFDIVEDEDAADEMATSIVQDGNDPQSAVARIEEYARTHDLDDDITAVVIRRLPA
ncbi:MAG: SpoIIE family protein phosphatase [Aeromicrobium sp.]